ncbi:MAG TPA: DUF4142 domain-containing protein [Candidatus Baltobacteraceae bacterium]|nr:DUF4142 domain-containing protein [Candidatus Baltobacteraceae bacterium]
MKPLSVLAAVAFVFGASVPAFALGSSDASFVQTAQRDALGNYALAALARGKAQEPSAKALAAQLLTDASQASRFVKSFASAHGLKLDGKPALRADNQYANISSSSGKNFDKAFANAIHIDANVSLYTYQQEAAHGSDPALRSFAKHQVEVLRHVAAAAKKLSR